MRPSPGLDATSSRPRKPSDPIERPHLTSTPTTFFLTRDPDNCSNGTSNRSHETDASQVISLKETLEEADRQSKYSLPRHRQQEIRSNSRRRSTIKPHITEGSRLPGVPHIPSEYTTSTSALTPSASNSQHASLPSSPKSISSRSFAKSDDELTQDGTESEAVASSEDEHDEDALPEIQDSAPQLIMPSIKMPSRRPFTTRGKLIGRYKILVTGSKGSGKTSLIKSIVQLCEDIVHVDSMSAISKPSPRPRGNAIRLPSTMNEIHASTKPYPFWWSELDESRILKRQKSVGDAVLERNICFVDTLDSSRPERVIQYLEQQLTHSVNLVNQGGNELTGLLSGRGSSQVDLILYMLTKDTLTEDCNTIRRLSQICNTVPLISKVDLLAAEDIAEIKDISFSCITLPHLPFERSTEQGTLAKAPYSVSSANGSDIDNMDASLLMSPEYVRPLMSSELSLLVDQIFNPDIISYLRYTSAKKLASWYATEPRLTQISSPSVQSPQPSTLTSPLPTSLSNSGVLVPITSEISLNTSNSYALAKVADHTQREEHLAQIRLSKWASDLQLSLQRERERYECLARNERALWLVQRMGEEVRGGQVIPWQNNLATTRRNEKPRVLHPESRYETYDPLGLLVWQDTVRTRGWAALQIVGSFGVLGGVALWLAKTWGLTTSLHEWVHQWTTDVFSTRHD